MDPNDYYPNHSDSDHFNNDFNNNSNNDFNNNYSQPPRTPTTNSMAVASMVVGIASIVSLCCGGFGIPLGALGIIFALLSRRQRHMDTQAKVGLGLSIGSLALTFLFVILCVVFLVSSGIITQMIRIMQKYDLSTESGIEEFMEEWEDYIYSGDYYRNDSDSWSDTPGSDYDYGNDFWDDDSYFWDDGSDFWDDDRNFRDDGRDFWNDDRDFRDDGNDFGDDSSDQWL